ncbi:hypothetical protein HWV62_39361 [Athelia sp. TMB]|nr:hypothetical protein HWV62_39361 [Athelia sp. TMB]
MNSDATEAALGLLGLLSPSNIPTTAPKQIIPLKRKAAPPPPPPPAPRPPPARPPPLQSHRPSLAAPPQVQEDESQFNPDAINCICGSAYDDGFSIACDDCSRWCHAACFDIFKGGVPEEWKCWVCVPRPVDREKAVRLQRERERQQREAEVVMQQQQREQGRTSPGVEKVERAKPRKVSAAIDGGKDKRRRRASIMAPTMAPSTSTGPATTDDTPLTIDIEETYVPITADIVPHAALRAKLARHARNWRGVTALAPPPARVAVSPVSLPPSSVRLPSYALHTTSPVPPQALITPYPAQLTSTSAYLADPLNAYAHLGMPKPFVHLLGGEMGVALDSRTVGGEGRWCRSGCWPNAVVRPFLCGAGGEKGEGHDHGEAKEKDTQELRFGVFALRALAAGEEVVLGWEWDDGAAVHQLPALVRDPHAFPAPSPDKRDYLRAQMAGILHALGSTFVTCACGEKTRDCALARMAAFVEDDATPPASAGDVDLGPLVGTTRGFRARERVGGSGGLSGCEMDVDLEPSIRRRERWDADEEGDVDVEGDGDADADGTTEDELDVDGDGPPVAGPSRWAGMRKETRRVDVGEVAHAFRASNRPSLSPQELPRLTVSPATLSPSPRKGKGKARDGLVGESDEECHGPEGLAGSDPRRVKRARHGPPSGSASPSPSGIFSPHPHRAQTHSPSPHHLHPERYLRSPAIPSIPNVSKGKGKAKEPSDITNSNSAGAVPEEKMPPKMRKRWIARSAEVLRETLANGGGMDVDLDVDAEPPDTGQAGARMDVDPAPPPPPPPPPPRQEEAPVYPTFVPRANSMAISSLCSPSPSPAPYRTPTPAPPPSTLVYAPTSQSRPVPTPSPAPVYVPPVQYEPAPLLPTPAQYTLPSPADQPAPSPPQIHPILPAAPPVTIARVASPLAPSPSTSFSQLSLLSPVVPGPRSASPSFGSGLLRHKNTSPSPLSQHAAQAGLLVHGSARLKNASPSPLGQAVTRRDASPPPPPAPTLVEDVQTPSPVVHANSADVEPRLSSSPPINDVELQPASPQPTADVEPEPASTQATTDVEQQPADRSPSPPANAEGEEEAPPNGWVVVVEDEDSPAEPSRSPESPEAIAASPPQESATPEEEAERAADVDVELPPASPDEQDSPLTVQPDLPSPSLDTAELPRTPTPPPAVLDKEPATPSPTTIEEKAAEGVTPPPALADQPAREATPLPAVPDEEPVKEATPSPPSPPPAPKVKMSLKDFAMRKKKQREEEMAKGVVEGGLTVDTHAIGGEHAPSVSPVDVPMNGDVGMSALEVNGAKPGGAKDDVREMKAEGKENVPADRSDQPKEEPLLNGNVPDEPMQVDGAPAPEPIRIPSPSAPSWLDQIRSFTSKGIPPSLPTDTIIVHSSVPLTPAAKPSQPEPPPSISASSKRAANGSRAQTPTRRQSVPVRPPPTEDGEIPSPATGGHKSSSFQPRAHTPPTQPRSFSMAVPASVGSSSPGAAPPRRPSQPARLPPSGPRALRPGHVPGSLAPRMRGGIPRGPSADRDRLDMDRERGWPPAPGRGWGAGGGAWVPGSGARGGR